MCALVARGSPVPAEVGYLVLMTSTAPRSRGNSWDSNGGGDTGSGKGRATTFGDI